MIVSPTSERYLKEVHAAITKCLSTDLPDLSTYSSAYPRPESEPPDLVFTFLS